MPRNVSLAYLTAIQSQIIRPALFVEADFTTGPTYLWNGNGPITWNGHTWLGVGTFGSVSTIEESSNVEAKGISLTLSGFDAAYVTHVLNEVQQGKPAIVYVGLFDATGTTLIPDPVIAFSGRMDQPTISVGGDTASITIQCESRLVDMNTPVDRRRTSDDQQIDHPGDRGLEFVSGIQETLIYWGRVPRSHNNQ